MGVLVCVCVRARVGVLVCARVHVFVRMCVWACVCGYACARMRRVLVCLCTFVNTRVQPQHIAST